MKRFFAILMICMAGLMLLSSARAEDTAPRLVLSEAEVRLAVGKSVTLKAAVENPPSKKKGKAAWESSDPAVCTVSASGAVKAVSEGTAVITCTMTLPEGGTLTAQCAVSTFVAAKTLKAVNKEILLGVGVTTAGEYTLLPENVTEKALEWTSADEGVATVDAEGRITGVAPGTAKVTAQTKDGSGLKAVYTVSVPSLSAAAMEYTISELGGLTVPVSYYGTDADSNVSVKVTGKPLRVTRQYEDNRILLHLDALEAGDSRIEISDKKDKKSKAVLTVHTEEAAVWNSIVMEISGIELQWKKGELNVRIRAVNHSSRKTKEVGYTLDFRTQSGEQRVYSGILEGNSVPTAISFWTRPWKINPGAKGGEVMRPMIIDELITDTDITEVRCALYSVVFEDGSYIKIPDSQRYWFSSASGYLQKPDVLVNYMNPTQDILDKADQAKLGFSTADASDFLLSWYGAPGIGKYITRVSPDSVADICGLQLKDVIFEADGIRFSDDPYMITRARARIADGETVIFKVYRDGGVVELAFRK